jgi:hypothetical protein
MHQHRRGTIHTRLSESQTDRAGTALAGVELLVTAVLPAPLDVHLGECSPGVVSVGGGVLWRWAGCWSVSLMRWCLCTRVMGTKIGSQNGSFKVGRCRLVGCWVSVDDGLCRLPGGLVARR